MRIDARPFSKVAADAWADAWARLERVAPQAFARRRKKGRYLDAHLLLLLGYLDVHLWPLGLVLMRLRLCRT